MRANSRRSRVIAVGITAAPGFGPLTGCSGDTGPARPGGEVTVRSQEITSRVTTRTAGTAASQESE
jgi:multiple sugar transport system substrate-binding protein